MKTVVDISELRTQIQQWRSAQQTIALVPTMGNLHAGHLSLVERALSLAQRVVVSIFVNPMQFGAGEDYQTYPRTLAADQQQLESLGVHLLFTPTTQAIYPDDLNTATYVEVPHLSQILCGASRPGHFRGVATVVNLLFNLVQPHFALFGQKDYQQLLIIKKMVADLQMPIEIMSMPTVREPDGLAMSSRNNYLTPEQRAIAPGLYQTLNKLKEQIKRREDELTNLEAQAFNNLEKQGFKPDYLTARQPHNLAQATISEKNMIILAAAHLGSTRLIDNLIFINE
jgi:pantoate--beta-alanine ligase